MIMPNRPCLKYILCFLTITACTYAIPSTTHAQVVTNQQKSIQMCGTAINNKRNIGSADKTCDVYSRQFDYREKRIEFRDMIENRRAEYIAPSLEIQKKYQADIKQYHKSLEQDAEAALQ